MTLTFTIPALYAGSAAGPFDIYGVVSGQTVESILTNGTDTAQNIPRATLDAGYTMTGINDLITGGTIYSVGSCTTSATWSTPGFTPLYEIVDIIGFSPLDAQHAEDSVPLNPTQHLYYPTSGNLLYYTDTEMTLLAEGWYVFYNEEFARHIVDGAEVI